MVVANATRVFYLLGWMAASGDGRGAQQLFVERGVIFARIDSKLQATHLVCCILSSLGPDSLCMYMIVVLCGGTSSPPVSFTWQYLPAALPLLPSARRGRPAPREIGPLVCDGRCFPRFDKRVSSQLSSRSFSSQ